MMLEILECFRGFCLFRSLKKGNPRSPNLDKNRFKAAMQPVSFWTSLMVAGASMAMIAFIFSGLTRIPWLLMMNPSRFPNSMPKTHFIRFSFHWNLHNLSNVSYRLLVKSSGFLVLTTTSSTYASMLRCSCGPRMAWMSL